jgi:hypothetical protein
VADEGSQADLDFALYQTAGDVSLSNLNVTPEFNKSTPVLQRNRAQGCPVRDSLVSCDNGAGDERRSSITEQREGIVPIQGCGQSSKASKTVNSSVASRFLQCHETPILSAGLKWRCLSVGSSF